jgi:2-polyprenyl-3-methyl-5-hydroxy-6-metoxy-1,4-benzoquinol methylase
MQYTEQEKFLRSSRIWGMGLILVLFGTVGACITAGETSSLALLALYAALASALAVFIYYTPDYLHLTVDPRKRSRWAVKIRWRIIAAALIISGLLASNARERAWVAMAIVWLLALNLFGQRVPKRFVPLYFWLGDIALLAALLFVVRIDLLLATLLLAAAAHLAITVADRPASPWVGVVSAVSVLLVFIAAWRQGVGLSFALALSSVVLVASLATAYLVYRAEERNAENVKASIHELNAFTGYPAERILHLWAISNQELAKNWQQAAIAPDDQERLKEWYRQNSELYLFALSGYNLEYKRIRSNLNMLKRARGSCLDYGAGNGELLLEAARTNRAVYYDVEGETMRFARARAAQRNLAIQFVSTKAALATAAQLDGFDIIFSLDVLEHLPDLPGELDFLASLLNPEGLLVFDVPAGATKSHPMHLNHDLDVVTFMRAKGFKDERSLWQKLPFKKEEKYFFRAPRDPKSTLIAVQGADSKISSVARDRYSNENTGAKLQKSSARFCCESTQLKAPSPSAKLRVGMLSRCSCQTELARNRFHRINAKRNVLFQIDAQISSAIDNVVAVHAAGKSFVLHLLAHGLRFHLGQRLVRLDQRACRDEAGDFVASVERLFHPTFTLHAAVVGMGENGAAHVFRIAALFQNLVSHKRMLGRRGIFFIIKVMQQAGDAPLVLVLAKLASIGAHARFHGQHVLAQAF